MSEQERCNETAFRYRNSRWERNSDKGGADFTNRRTLLSLKKVNNPIIFLPMLKIAVRRGGRSVVRRTEPDGKFGLIRFDLVGFALIRLDSPAPISAQPGVPQGRILASAKPRGAKRFTRDWSDLAGFGGIWLDSGGSPRTGSIPSALRASP